METYAIIAYTKWIHAPYRIWMIDAKLWSRKIRLLAVKKGKFICLDLPHQVTLNWHALINALKNSNRKSIVKKHGEKGFKQVLERSDGVLDFSGPNFCFEQVKVD